VNRLKRLFDDIRLFPDGGPAYAGWVGYVDDQEAAERDYKRAKWEAQTGKRLRQGEDPPSFEEMMEKNEVVRLL
jgi:hypothetical protein